MSVVGLITSKAALVDTVHEGMIVPSKVLNDEEKGEVLHGDMEYVEKVGRLINKEIRKRVPECLVEELQNHYFAAMRTYIFSEYFDLLLNCTSDEDYLSLMAKMDDAVFAALQRVFRAMSLRLGHDAHNIILQSNIQKRIFVGYKKMKEKRKNG